MRVKICGLRTLEDASFAAAQGAWALGFNFYPHSPRYIDPEKARQICLQLPLSVLKVGIFIATSEEAILEGLRFLDLAQIYAPLSNSFADKKRCIYAVQAQRVEELPPASLLEEYGYVLLDAPRTEEGLLGGTGRLADWTLAKQLTRQYKLLLAGGIDADNLAEAEKVVHPFAVDVASGVEHEPGVKDYEKLKQLIGSAPPKK